MFNTRGAFRTFYFSEIFRDSLRISEKRQVQNANSTQHLKYFQRISEILKKIQNAKRASVPMRSIGLIRIDIKQTYMREAFNNSVMASEVIDQPTRRHAAAVADAAVDVWLMKDSKVFAEEP